MSVFQVLKCPCCGRGYAARFWLKIAQVAGRSRVLGWLMRARGGYAKRKEHGFEVIKELTLRREISAEAFAAVKARLMDAVKLWLQKGWLSLAELRAMMGELRMEQAGAWLFMLTAEAPNYKRPLRKEYKGIEVERPVRPPAAKSFEILKF